MRLLPLREDSAGKWYLPGRGKKAVLLENCVSRCGTAYHGGEGRKAEDAARPVHTV